MKVMGSLAAIVMLTGLPALALAQAAPPAKPAAKAAAAPAKAAGAAGVRVIKISATETMKFDPASITATKGEKLRIVLTSVGTMPKIAMAHNFVMLKPGSDEAAFVNASATARPDFIAPSLKSQVLVSSQLAGGGETVSVELTAPAKPGRYTFICTFPGHFASGMKGVLIVK